MKAIRYPLFLLIVSAGLAIPAAGQEPPDEMLPEGHKFERPPPPHHDHRAHRRGDAPPPEHLRRDHDGGGPLDRLMNHLREADPKAFEELQRLRKEDPRAFRRHLKERRDHLRREEFMDSMAEFPPLLEAIEKMPSDQREMLRERLQGALDVEKRRVGNRTDLQVRKLEKELRQKAEAYRNVQEAEQDGAKEEIRASLEKIFDAREALRARQVEEAEKRLEKLKKAMASRASNREKIMERRLLELTDGDPLAW